MEFVQSSKGKPMLINNGFIYVKDKISTDGRIFWKCTYFNKKKCSARKHTLEDNIIKLVGEHNHVPDGAAIKAKRVMGNVIQRARNTQDSGQSIVAKETYGIENGVVAAFPNTENMKKTIRRQRKISKSLPANPSSLTDLQIPEAYTSVSLNGGEEKFLLFDSGPSPNRILIFSTKKNLELLKRCEDWYVDGTFKVTPPLFGQLYTIYGVPFNNVIPSVFTLLPNKSKDTYVKFITELKKLKDDLRPKSVMIDFEKAAINAFETEFTETTIRGCLFHFSQSIWRQVQKAGLSQRYVDDVEFSTQIRMLLALAFVPLNDVIPVFEQLLDSEFYSREIETLQPLVDYFEDTWIGRPTRRDRRRDPMFSIKMWNNFETVKNGMPRTNNAVEGWHLTFSHLLRSSHPDIWTFIDTLKKEQSTNNVNIEHYIQGRLPPKSKPKYREITKRLETCIARYGNIDNIDYLRGVSYNLQFNV